MTINGLCHEQRHERAVYGRRVPPGMNGVSFSVRQPKEPMAVATENSLDIPWATMTSTWTTASAA